MKRIQITPFSILAFATLLASPAFANSPCFNTTFGGGLTMNVEAGGEEKNAFPAGAAVTPAPDQDELFGVLFNLNGGWAPSSASWPASAVQVHMSDGGAEACHVIYTRSEIYAQNQDLSGYLYKALNQSDFIALSNALFSTASQELSQ